MKKLQKFLLGNDGGGSWQFKLLFFACSLFALEIFYYYTSARAFQDLLGTIYVPWGFLLAIAFCSIDINPVWTGLKWGYYLRGWFRWMFWGWVIASLMASALQWWALSLWILEAQTLGNAIVTREFLIDFAPLTITIVIWLIRFTLVWAVFFKGSRYLIPTHPLYERLP